jgi:hypothetical protein
MEGHPSTEHTDRDSRTRLGVSLAAVLGLLELDLWWLCELPAWWPRAVSFATIAAVVGWVCWRRAAGGAAQPVRGAWPAAAVATALLAALLTGLAALMAWPAPEQTVWIDKTAHELALWMLTKLVVVWLQQLGLQWFLAPTCAALLGRARGHMVAVILFALLHLPNFSLVLLTGLAGLVWVVLYQHWRRVAPLVASHLVLAVLVHAVVPERVIHDLRVGSRMWDEWRRESLRRHDGTLELQGLPQQIGPNQPLRGRVVIHNRSPFRWSGAGAMRVCVALRVRDYRTGEVMGQRIDLPGSGIAPDQTGTVQFDLRAPARPGRYEVACRLFQRGWSPFPGAASRAMHTLEVTDTAPRDTAALRRTVAN